MSVKALHQGVFLSGKSIGVRIRSTGGADRPVAEGDPPKAPQGFYFGAALRKRYKRRDMAYASWCVASRDVGTDVA